MTTESQLQARKLWAATLRSGKYAKGEGAMKTSLTEKPDLPRYDKFCCLGIACELHRLESKNQDNWSEVAAYSEGSAINRYQGQHAVLPVSVQDWLGIDCQGSLPNPIRKNCDHTYSALIFMNDLPHTTFDEIANVIEDQFIKPFEGELSK